MASFLNNTKNGVSIIDSIPHCHTENALKRGLHQEMWLRYYKEDKIRVSVSDSIPHRHTENALKRGKTRNLASFLY